MSKMVPVKGYEGYFFDENYNIWSFVRKTPRQLKPFVRWKGKGSRQKHLRVSIACKNVAVHRLVYETFKGEIPPGHMVRHLDDNEYNNVPENLATGTHQDNSDDCIRNKRVRGKLSFQQAREILILGLHFEVKELQEFYGVSGKTIRSILNGTTWAHLDRSNLKFENQKEVI